MALDATRLVHIIKIDVKCGASERKLRDILLRGLSGSLADNDLIQSHFEVFTLGGHIIVEISIEQQEAKRLPNLD